MTIKDNNEFSDYSFEQLCVCDKAVSHYGYTFWGEGTRHIKKEGLRDLFTKATKGTSSSISLPPIILTVAAVIYNACDSCPVFLRRGKDVQEFVES